MLVGIIPTKDHDVNFLVGIVGINISVSTLDQSTEDRGGVRIMIYFCLFDTEVSPDVPRIQWYDGDCMA